jgi:hypothetical protein
VKLNEITLINFNEKTKQKNNSNKKTLYYCLHNYAINATTYAINVDLYTEILTGLILLLKSPCFVNIKYNQSLNLSLNMVFTEIPYQGSILDNLKQLILSATNNKVRQITYRNSLIKVYVTVLFCSKKGVYNIVSRLFYLNWIFNKLLQLNFVRSNTSLRSNSSPSPGKIPI